MRDTLAAFRPLTAVGWSATMWFMHTIPSDPGRRGVVAVIVRHDRLLVIRRSNSVVAPRAYCFPGGGIEPGESEPEALQRELREELNVAVQPVRCVWQSVTPWEVQLSWWLTKMSDDAEPIANPAEVESAHWCTPSEMARLPGLLESNRHFLDAFDSGEIVLDF